MDCKAKTQCILALPGSIINVNQQREITKLDSFFRWGIFLTYYCLLRCLYHGDSGLDVKNKIGRMGLDGKSSSNIYIRSIISNTRVIAMTLGGRLSSSSWQCRTFC